MVILSHRKQQFIGQTLWTLRNLGRGITDVVVVDDSGDPEHHQWLDDHGFQFSLTHPRGKSVGYLQSMNVVWQAARSMADERGVDYVLLWEEDFQLIRLTDFFHLAAIMSTETPLAQLNLQRQAVYGVERRHGYLESHQRRGYELVPVIHTDGSEWVRRRRPFTTNPGMIRREVLDIDWPTRGRCDSVEGGAEPAMSLQLEGLGWHFGWYGDWNTPSTHHVGNDMKTGSGY